MMRHYNCLIEGFESDPRTLAPVWATRTYRGKDYDEAEGWVYGFNEGVRLCWNDCQPLMTSLQGQAWYSPIGLLVEDDFGADQDEQTKTPAKLAKLAR